MREDMKAVIADTFTEMLDKEDIDKITVTKLERLLYSQRWVEIESMLTESAAAYLAEMARNKAPDISLSYDELEIMLKFYACGMVGVLMHYMGKPHLDEEKLIIQMEKIITGKMFPGKSN